MAKKRRSDDAAVEQSRHLLYEIQMLAALRQHFLTGDHDRAVSELARKGLVARNALIESFQIHARQLIDFLLDRGARREATASAFVTDGWSVPAADRKELPMLSEEFSERVAHLTWRRSEHTDVEQRVMTEAIYAEMQRHLLTFLDRVDPARVRPEFVEEARKALGPPVKKPASTDDLIPGSPIDVLRATTYTGGTATGSLLPGHEGGDTSE